jgi:hypothetical protein
MILQFLGISDPWSIDASSFSEPAARNGRAIVQRNEIERISFLRISNPIFCVIVDTGTEY